MKSKYSFWIICLISLASLAGCQTLESNFYYEPETPCAGKSVTFYNKSTGADDYYWNFGDNGTSTSTSPSHIFQKPGTYTVTLQIVRNKVEKKSCSKQVVVIDSIPTIAHDSDSIYTYTPTTFKVRAYNPWKKKLTYHWHLPKQAVAVTWADDSSTVKCYFTQEMTNCNITVDFTMGDKSFALTCSDTIFHQASSSVLYRASEQNYEQFMYLIDDERLFQTASQTSSSKIAALLNAETDTIGYYGETITRKTVSDRVGKQVDGFQIDNLMAKIYAYNSEEGLWVSNINGGYVRSLVPAPVYAIKVDGASNRLYWANSTGLHTHRLIQLSTNADDFDPQTVNEVSTISGISVYTDKH